MSVAEALDTSPPNIRSQRAEAPPPANPAAVRAHMEMLQSLATSAGVEGVLVLFAAGENPQTGKKMPPVSQHFSIGDVEGMTNAALSLGRAADRNVYAPWCIFRSDLPAGRKGAEADVVSVLAIVADIDNDKPTDGVTALPAPYVIESSPGNYQSVFPLASALLPAAAKPIAVSLADNVDCDKRTKDVSGVWRIPGLLNWPTKAKLKRGRRQEPFMVEAHTPWSGELVEPSQIVSLQNDYLDIEACAGSNLPVEVQNTIEHGKSGDRSGDFQSAVNSMRNRGMSFEDALAMFEANPTGPAAKYIQGGRLETELRRSWAAADDGRGPRKSPLEPGAINVPFVREEVPAERFPVEHMGPLRRAALAIADITQAPIAVCAQSVLTAASLSVQALADTDRPGGGKTPLSLFALTIALTGERKSGADRLAMKGVRAYERSLAQAAAVEIEIYNARKASYDAQRKAALKETEKVEEALLALGSEPARPLSPTITTSAPTLEGIIKNLGELRPSLGVFSEEGGAFLGGHSMKAENRAAAMAELSTIWDAATLTRWRAGDGASTFSGRRLAAHLMVQPSVAPMLLGDRVAIGQGILGRFLIVSPVSTQGDRDWHHKPDYSSQLDVDSFAEKVRSRLDHVLPLRNGTTNVLDPRHLPFSADGKRLIAEYGNEIEAGLKANVYGASIGAANKSPEQAARIAGVMAMFEDPGAVEVKVELVEDAIALARHYLTEAVRLTDTTPLKDDDENAEKLREWLCEKWTGPQVTARDIANRGPNSIRSVAVARNALTLLETHGYVQSANIKAANGRQREVWHIAR
ncbi:MAG: YfjI family protein [Pseudomonadota bacterium]